MRLKLYRAASMAEAMAGVRAELGPDALILGTRRVAGGVEVTAALEQGEPLLPAHPAPPSYPLLAFHGVPSALQARLGRGALAQALASCFRFEPLPLTGEHRAPLLFAGPPGGGKTLTVARLATRFVLSGTKPLVISADGKRAGGVEQLAAFTRLLGIELIVASHPVTLARAVARRAEGAPVLVDGPGADPFDQVQREEVAGLAATAGAAVALVLPGGLNGEEAAEMAEGFAEIGARWLVPTRLDQTRRLGGVVAAAHAGGLALSEAGTGPGAADGLTPMTASFLADLMTRAAGQAHPSRRPDLSAQAEKIKPLDMERDRGAMDESHRAADHATPPRYPFLSPQSRKGIDVGAEDMGPMRGGDGVAWIGLAGPPR